MKLKVVKIVEIVCTCLAAVLAIGFAFFIFQKIAFEDKPIKLMGISIFEVTSNELSNKEEKKSIDQGDLIITLKNKNYKVDDVILYTDNGKYYISRVQSVDNGVVTIPKYGGLDIEQSNIIGKKVLLFDNYSSFRQTILSPVTIIIIGVVFFGGLIVCFVLEKVFTAQIEKAKEEAKEEIIEDKNQENE